LLLFDLVLEILPVSITHLARIIYRFISLKAQLLHSGGKIEKGDVFDGNGGSAGIFSTGIRADRNV
jgi:hypothetical protein